MEERGRDVPWQKVVEKKKKIQNILLTNLNQQVGWRREGEMYLVRLPPDPRPTQARDGVATNDWLSWEFPHFPSPFQVPHFPSRAHPAVGFFFVWSQGEQVPLRQGGEHLLCYTHLFQQFPSTWVHDICISGNEIQTSRIYVEVGLMQRWTKSSRHEEPKPGLKLLVLCSFMFSPLQPPPSVLLNKLRQQQRWNWTSGIRKLSCSARHKTALPYLYLDPVKTKTLQVITK